MQHGICIDCGALAKGTFVEKREAAVYDWHCKDRRCRASWRGLWDGTPVCTSCGSPMVQVGSFPGGWKDVHDRKAGEKQVWSCPKC